MKYTEEDIKHWQGIICCVFKAEDKIKGTELLKNLKEKYNDDMKK